MTKNVRAPRTRLTRLLRCTKYWYFKIVRQHASAHTTARGVTLGYFIGALPIIPFQSICAILLAFVFRTNKLITWLATGYSNVFTLVPFYYLLFRIGRFLMPFENVVFDPHHLSMSDLLQNGWRLFVVMMAGGVVFGVVGSVILYFATLYAVRRYHALKRERRRRRREARRVGE